MKNKQLIEIYPEIDREFFDEASYYLLRLADLWGEDLFDFSDDESYLWTV